jgi:hypothetical protein
MSICIVAAGKVVSIGASVFTLGWTHSVERVPWEEVWRLDGGRLVLLEARVKGSGAGMEAPADAVLVDGWWRYRPKIVPVRELALAASDAVPGGWRLCGGSRCRTLGALPDAAGPITIVPCDAQADHAASALSNSRDGNSMP